eukprot:gene44505-34712_t
MVFVAALDAATGAQQWITFPSLRLTRSTWLWSRLQQTELAVDNRGRVYSTRRR